MAHQHHHHKVSDSKNLKTAFFLNLIFSLIEVIGGFFTNSIAILSDALHDLGDTFSLGFAWYMQKFSEKGRDKKYSYGYKRFSLLGALINTIILLIGSILIIWSAIPRIISPEVSNVKGMILIAFLGLIFNVAAVLKLDKGKSMNEKVARLHLLEDVLGWVAVLIGAMVMYFFDLPVIDPILSILIAVYILFNVYKNLKQTLRILLQGIPVNADVMAIKYYLNNLKDVESIHDFHIWSMDGEYNILTVHLVMEEEALNADLEQIKNEIKANLKTFGAHHSTIEFESVENKCDLINC